VGTAGVEAWAARWAPAGAPGAAEGRGAAPDRSDLLAHHRLIEAACAGGACLPVRFGTWLADAQALEVLLAARAPALRAALERLRGRRELALTVLWATRAAGDTTLEDAIPDQAPPRPGPGPGRRFLETRGRLWTAREQRRDVAAGLSRRVERLAGDLVGDLAGGGQTLRQRLCPGPEVALSSAILVPQGRVGVALERLRRPGAVAPAGAGLRVLVNGPWPPYSFCGPLESGAPDSGAPENTSPEGTG
jgi:hypothetical protein